MRVGDQMQYNKKYKPSEVVTIMEIKDRHCLVQFPNGSKLCTRINGLWPLNEDYFRDGCKRFEQYKAQLKLF